MGLGDEIMALGRAETIYEDTGKPVSIHTQHDSPKDHDAYHGNPAWIRKGGKRIVDGGGVRPYIQHWKGRQAIYNLEYRARAGRVYLTKEERRFNTLDGPYAVVAPDIKQGASPNKRWGRHNWEAVIKDFPVPVYQLLQDDKEQAIEGAIPFHTPTWRKACAVIERAALVMCTEGGTHHMAASMRVPAVVVFGSFVPPQVTGYAFHYNIAVETEEGYCGRWEPCPHCAEALKSIKPETVRQYAIMIMESYDEY